MTEQQIRNIVRQEMERAQERNRFNLSRLQNHEHNGVDSPFIPFSNITASASTTGPVTLARTTKYTFKTTFRPKQVLFYGTAVNNNGSSPTIRSFIVGSAQFGGGYLLQPDTTNSVKMGGLNEGIIQSSSQIYVDSSGASPVFHVTNNLGTALVEAAHSTVLSGVDARAVVTNFTSNSVEITVTILSSGWQIIGNFTIM